LERGVKKVWTKDFNKPTNQPANQPTIQLTKASRSACPRARHAMLFRQASRILSLRPYWSPAHNNLLTTAPQHHSIINNIQYSHILSLTTIFKYLTLYVLLCCFHSVYDITTMSNRSANRPMKCKHLLRTSWDGDPRFGARSTRSDNYQVGIEGELVKSIL
jgi:hypothetical protein